MTDKFRLLKIKHINDASEYYEKTVKTVVFQGYYDDISTENLLLLLRKYQEIGAKIIYDIIGNPFDLQMLISSEMSEDDALTVIENAALVASNSDLLITQDTRLQNYCLEKFTVPVIVDESFIQLLD